MGKIVVGIDGSAGSAAALRFALEEARLRDATLHAVHAWELPFRPSEATSYVPVGEPAADHDLEGVVRGLDTAAREALEASLGDADPSGVDLRAESFEGSPADVILEAAKDADLIVVGSRGRGAIRELVLGSASQKVAHHARCPVVIVRPSNQETRRR
jgi:nucleotide-binding universal stress UspA family protein